MEKALFNILVFPGIFFLTSLGFIAEYIDRKLSARFQNRIGPPWYQPLADFIKLVAKEDVICEDADAGIFKLMPVLRSLRRSPRSSISPSGTTRRCSRSRAM
jgi:NADH-quinone oxidoreductase subunit H